MEEGASLPKGWKGDGIITAARTKETVRLVKRQHVPVINVSAIEYPGANWPRVLVNEKEIGKLAFSHFREKGFIHFAFVGSDAVWVQKRAKLYIDIVESQGFKCAHYMYADG